MIELKSVSNDETSRLLDADKLCCTLLDLLWNEKQPIQTHAITPIATQKHDRTLNNLLLKMLGFEEEVSTFSSNGSDLTSISKMKIKF